MRAPKLRNVQLDVHNWAGRLKFSTGSCLRFILYETFLKIKFFLQVRRAAKPAILLSLPSSLKAGVGKCRCQPECGWALRYRAQPREGVDDRARSSPVSLYFFFYDHACRFLFIYFILFFIKKTPIVLFVDSVYGAGRVAVSLSFVCLPPCILFTRRNTSSARCSVHRFPRSPAWRRITLLRWFELFLCNDVNRVYCLKQVTTSVVAVQNGCLFRLSRREEVVWRSVFSSRSEIKKSCKGCLAIIAHRWMPLLSFPVIEGNVQ